MEIIIRNNGEYTLTNIVDDEIDLFRESNEEILLDIPFSDEEKQKIYDGCEIKDDMTILETEKYKEIQTEKLKREKSEQILKIASLSDQLNLLASCIEILAEGNTDPRLEYAREKFNEIKEVLKIL